MGTKTFEIIASLKPKARQDFGKLSSRGVVRKMLIAGYERFSLKGALIEHLADAITFYVDDDINYIVEEYLYSEDILKTKESFHYGIFLSDGLLTADVQLRDRTVDLNLRYCRFLNKNFLVNHDATITRNEYLWWWRSIAFCVLKVLNEKNWNVNKNKIRNRTNRLYYKTAFNRNKSRSLRETFKITSTILLVLFPFFFTANALNSSLFADVCGKEK